MGFKIIQPTTNPDTLGRGGVVIPGTPDQKIEFPTTEGTLSLTSQIPNSPTIYPLTSNINVNTTNAYIISDWDLSVTSGKVYGVRYYLYGEGESTSGFLAQFYCTGSTFLRAGELSTKDLGAFISENSSYLNLKSENTGASISQTYGLLKESFAEINLIIRATETGTIRHVLKDSSYTSGNSSSLFADRSFMVVTELN